MKIALAAVALNVALKIVLFEPLGASGLALATAIGAWLNFALLMIFAIRRGDMKIDKITTRVAIAATCASVLLALVALIGRDFSGVLAVRISTAFASEIELIGLMLIGALAYGGALLALLPLLGVHLGQLKPLRRSVNKSASQL